MEGAVSDYFNTQLTTDYFKNLYNNTVSYVYVLSYYGATPPTSEIEGFYYNTTNNKLYDSTKTERSLAPNALYFYDGHLYVPVSENGVYILKEGALS